MKLTWDIVRSARHEHATQQTSYTDLAKKYGVDISAMRRAVLGHTWRKGA